MILLGLLFAFAAPAQAGAAFSCPMFAAVEGSERLEICDDNGVLSQAALDCVSTYYNHVQAAQAEVLRKFQEQVQAQKKEQSDSYDRTQAGYNNLRGQLEGLIAEGKVARAAVDDYYLNFFFPPDYDEPEVTHMSTRDYLSANECYAEPEKVVKKAQLMIDKIMNDLATTEEAAFGKQNTSTTRSAHVQLLDNKAQVKHTVGEGSGKFIPGGEDRAPASDITGTEKKHEDLPTK